MVSILDGEFAETVANALADALIPYDLTLTRTAIPDSPPYDAWDPPAPVETAYACQGFIDQYREDELAGTLIEANDRKVMIVTGSLSITPKPGDLIAARSEPPRYIVSVKADPALALWECQVRA